MSEQRPVVLVVEDEPSNVALLESLLRGSGYEVASERSGSGAIAAAHRYDPDVMLLDVGLPGIDGLEVCRRLRADPALATLPVILVTGRADLADVVAGLDAGADDFVSKPYRPAELLARIRSALRLRQAITEMEAAHGVVAALANAVEAKDATTERHCQRLAGYAGRLATTVGISGAELKAITYGALLHDIGKIGVSDAILNKPGPLTEIEWVEMRRHTEIGERICEPLASSRLFAPIVRHHHERWDGKGYPDGLAKERIPLGARIVGLVDAFDAMVNHRPYRVGLSLDAALAEVERNAGRQFDPELVPLFLASIEAAVPTTLPPAALAGLRVAG